jgi:hypothetical protein
MEQKMHKIVGCRIIEDDINVILQGSPYPYHIDFIESRYHKSPQRLREMIQEIIDAASGYHYIILTYGFCGGALDGIMSRDVPLVFPKIHDCIDMLMGSTEERRSLCMQDAGVYFLSNGWMKEDGTPAERIERGIELLGREEGESLKDFIYGSYQSEVLIKTGTENEEVLERARESANRMKWSYRELDGDLSLLRRLILKDWDDEDIMILKPGERLTREYIFGN